ncbi:hypothetical protein BN132_2139 [Cronobacter turicensis 564]|nr:hypothetical protein BN132_2139 [Cronobacter turicensis 564]
MFQLRHFGFERLNTAIQLFHGRFLDKQGLRHIISGARLVAHMLLNPAFSVPQARRAVFTGGFESVKKPVNQTLLFRLHDSSLCH